MEKETKRFASVLGLTVVAGLLTGFAGLLFAGLAFLFGEWVGAGASLVAAALAFGLLANAILRA